MAIDWYLKYQLITITDSVVVIDNKKDEKYDQDVDKVTFQFNGVSVQVLGNGCVFYNGQRIDRLSGSRMHSLTKELREKAKGYFEACINF
ncbi:hypothetical protein KKC16_02895 [Patescibacteria group bacterium]|nr:hypothetical protein [Patescibacteria group bacterium]